MELDKYIRDISAVSIKAHDYFPAFEERRRLDDTMYTIKYNFHLLNFTDGYDLEWT